MCLRAEAASESNARQTYIIVSGTILIVVGVAGIFRHKISSISALAFPSVLAGLASSK